MLGEFIQVAGELVRQYGGNPTAATEILNDQFGSLLQAFGVSRIVVVDSSTIVLSVRGHNKGETSSEGPIKIGSRTIELETATLAGQESIESTQHLKNALDSFVPAGDGAHVWIVPDGFMAELTDKEKQWEREGVGYFSHEALCVQNTGTRKADCELFVYFEEAGVEVLRHSFEVGAHSSQHLRLDKIPSGTEDPFIPKSFPVGYKVVSYNEPVVVQGSRILTSGKESEFASFGSVMAWTPINK